MAQAPTTSTAKPSTDASPGQKSGTSVPSAAAPAAVGTAVPGKEVASAALPAGGSVNVTVTPAQSALDLDLPTADSANQVEDNDGVLRDVTVADPLDIIKNEGNNTDQSPAPREQTTPGATDPMKRGVAELAGPEPAKPGEEDYVLTRKFYDASGALHSKGEVMSFAPQDAPSTARLVTK